MRAQKFVVVLVLILTIYEVQSDQDEDRKWFPFPFRLPRPPPQVEQFFSQIPTHAKNFLDNILPKPLRNLFPSPPGLDTENFQSDESRSHSGPSVISMPDWSSDDEEKGSLRGPGRDVIRNLENHFSNMSAGLDSNDNFFRGILNGFKEQVKAIVPGTQWCGDGNRARSDEELGLFFKTDGCCREHDSCPEFIGREAELHGLRNGGLFTRSHCACDRRFYDCLKEAADMISAQVGTAYFTALGPQCFRLDRPVLDCRTRRGITNRCVEYQFDERKNVKKIYQWFDNPEF